MHLDRFNNLYQRSARGAVLAFLLGCVGVGCSFKGTTAPGVADVPPGSTTPGRSPQTYYVSQTTGLDTNDGLTPSSAWKTIAHLNSLSFIPGDTILLRQGETWHESLAFSSSGTAAHPITVAAYSDSESRDFNKEPFISGSVWNTAIGSLANFSAAPGISGLTGAFSSYFGNSYCAIWKATSDDPIKKIYYNAQAYNNLQTSTWQNTGNSASVEAAILAGSSLTFPSESSNYRTLNSGTVLLPETYQKRSAYYSLTTALIPSYAVPSPDWDGHMSVIQPNGQVLETYGTIILSSGDVVALYAKLTNARGDGSGWNNGARASGIPNYAGVIRDGEFTSGTIRHPLALVVGPSVLTTSAVWPASSFDTTTSSYAGTLPMGALLALPPAFNINSLTSTAGRTLATALKNYGGYVVDSGGPGVFMAVNDFNANDIPSSATIAGDYATILSNLKWVDNNSPTAIGGGGTPTVAAKTALMGDGYATLKGSDVVAGWTTAAAPSAANLDSFESGSAGAFWTAVGGASDATTAHGGTKSWKFNSASALTKSGVAWNYAGADMWFRVSSTSTAGASDQTNLGSVNWGGGVANTVWIWLSKDGAGKFFLGMGKEGDTSYSNFSLATDTWYHLSWDASAGAGDGWARLMINGQVIKTVSGLSISSPFQSLTVGQSNWQAANFVTNIDDLNIYNSNPLTNLWSAPFTSAPLDLYADANKLSLVATKNGVISPGQWWWDAGGKRIYLYSSQIPTSLFQHYGVEATARKTLDATGSDHLLFSGLHFAQGASLIPSGASIDTRHALLGQ